MKQNSAKIQANSKIILSLSGLSMHQFVNKTKTKIAEGKCLILQSNDFSQNVPLLFIRMNNFDFCKQLNNSLFVRIIYSKSTSFLYFNQFQEDVVYAISSTNNSAELPTLSQILMKSAKIIDYQSSSLKYQDKIRIDYHAQNILQNQVIIDFNRTAKIARLIGNFFGKINRAIQKPSHQINKAYDKNLQKIRHQSLSQSTQQNCNKIQKAASNVNDKLTNTLKPIGNAVQGLAANLRASYENSTNKFVRSFREFTLQAQKSINEGYLTPEKPLTLNQSTAIPDSYKQMAANKQKLISDPSDPTPIL